MLFNVSTNSSILMNEATVLAALQAIENAPGDWAYDPIQEQHSAKTEELELRVSKGRLNINYSWSVLHEGNVLITSQPADTVAAAKRAAVAYAMAWVKDEVTA